MMRSSRSMGFLRGVPGRRSVAWLMLATWLLALGVGLANACVEHPAARAERAPSSGWSGNAAAFTAHHPARTLASPHSHAITVHDNGSEGSDGACAACWKLCTDESQTLPRAQPQGIDTAAHAVAITNAAWRRLDALPANALRHVISAGAPRGSALSAAIRFQRLNL